FEVVEVDRHFNTRVAQEHDKEFQRAHRVDGESARHHEGLLVEVDHELLAEEGRHVQIPDTCLDQHADAYRAIFHRDRRGTDILAAVEADAQGLVENTGADVDVDVIYHVLVMLGAGLRRDMLDVDQVLRVVAHLDDGGINQALVQVGIDVVSLGALWVVEHQVDITRVVAWRVETDFLQHLAFDLAVLVREVGFQATVAEHEYTFDEFVELTRRALRRRLVVPLDPDQPGALVFVNLERDRDPLVAADCHQRQAFDRGAVVARKVVATHGHRVHVGEMRGIELDDRAVQLFGGDVLQAAGITCQR